MSRMGCKRLARQPAPTCKHSTMPDQIWLSPELQTWVCAVSSSDLHFPDHATLQVKIQVPDLCTWSFEWYQLAVIPWATLAVPVDSLDFGEQTAHVCDSADLTQSFKTWSQQAEAELLHGLAPHLPIHKGYVGRGCALQTSKKVVNLRPLLKGRPGDPQPRSSFLGKLVYQWLKQLRRLQSFVRRSHALMDNPGLAADLCHIWKAVIRVPGFCPTLHNGGPRANMLFQVHLMSCLHGRRKLLSSLLKTSKPTIVLWSGGA